VHTRAPRQAACAHSPLPRVVACVPACAAERRARVTALCVLSNTAWLSPTALRVRLWPTAATSAPGLGPLQPHLRRDWAHCSHICTGTGPTAATSAPGLGPLQPHLHRDWAHCSHICAGTGPTRATSKLGSESRFPCRMQHWMPHVHFGQPCSGDCRSCRRVDTTGRQERQRGCGAICHICTGTADGCGRGRVATAARVGEGSGIPTCCGVRC
jgi:hypothetical protein